MKLPTSEQCGQIQTQGREMADAWEKQLAA